MLVRLDFKKSRSYVTVGLFDQDEAIQRMFESSVKTVNKESHKNEEFLDVTLMEMIEVETDSFDVSTKGETANEY